MSNAFKFFDDNLTRLRDPATDELAWNLNAGLKALALQLNQIEQQVGALQQRQQQIEADVRTIRSRSP